MTAPNDSTARTLPPGVTAKMSPSGHIVILPPDVTVEMVTARGEGAQ